MPQQTQERKSFKIKRIYQKEGNKPLKFQAYTGEYYAVWVKEIQKQLEVMDLKPKDDLLVDAVRGQDYNGTQQWSITKFIKVQHADIDTSHSSPAVAPSSVVRSDAKAGELTFRTTTPVNEAPNPLTEKDIKAMISQAKRMIEEEFKGAVSEEITASNSLLAMVYYGYMQKQRQEFEIKMQLYKDRLWNKR